MTTQTFENVAAMPAPTWRFLHMNDATVEIAEGFEPGGDVDIELDGAVLGEEGAFDDALAAAQEAFEATPAADPYLRNYGDEQADELGGLALSNYQRDLDAVDRHLEEEDIAEEHLRRRDHDFFRVCVRDERRIRVDRGEVGGLARHEHHDDVRIYRLGIPVGALHELGIVPRGKRVDLLSHALRVLLHEPRGGLGVALPRRVRRGDEVDYVHLRVD